MCANLPNPRVLVLGPVNERLLFLTLRSLLPGLAGCVGGKRPRASKLIGVLSLRPVLMMYLREKMTFLRSFLDAKSNEKHTPWSTECRAKGPSKHLG
jgi:hypothetical protein